MNSVNIYKKVSLLETYTDDCIRKHTSIRTVDNY